ncbi:MAG: membrane protein insertase YidC [Candidatus Marinarcus sp.]|uniref:membrane protein insertase YidC n=1 Tax=Candidatus Marinarcus sp. TaxID=3100987 RepID=UPI003AFFB0CC
MNNKDGMQKRMLLMTLIVFVFFVAYEFLVLKPQQEAKQQEKIKQEQTVKNQAPVAMTTDAAPVANNTVTTQAPSVNLSPKSVVSTIKTQKSLYEIDNLGRIAQVTLLESKYTDKDSKQIKLFALDQLRPLEVRFSDASINEEAFKVNVIANASAIDATQTKQQLVLTQQLSNLLVTKTITFYPDSHYDVTVKTSTPQTFFMTTGFRPNVLVDMYADHGALLKLNDGSLTTFLDEKMDKTESVTGVKFASAFDRYYTTVLYNFDKSMSVTVMKDEKNDPQMFIHGNTDLTLSGYAGPKEHILLKSLNPELVDVIEYGFFTFIAKPMFIFLQFLQGYIGNWGWTIVALTILIKLILFPLSYKGMVSMQKLKDLAPKIKDIQAKYKDDKQKQSTHMMELYKKNGANPMGGCLPLILQIPVFFSIYRVLLNSIELKGAPWILWIHDLAMMDPYYVLPLLMGASMFLQQKLTPNTLQDEMQKKIFQFLPVIFTFFFLWFPAGLTLYWVVNNIFTIGQQVYINSIFDKQKAIKK